MSLKIITQTFLSAILVVVLTRTAHSGPPLVTDDPGILDPGGWEIIAATTATFSSEGDVYQLPLLDVSYGVLENIQVGAVYPYVFVDPDDGSSDSEFGNLQLAAKWRFINAENLQVSVGSIYAFGISVHAAQRGVGDDEDILYLPVNLEYSWSDWRFNAEFGYASIKNADDGLGYGAAIAHPLTSRAEIMFELYGGSETDFSEDNLNFNVGFDVEMSQDMHLLFAVGSGLKEPDGEASLDLEIYLGLQLLR